MGIVRRLPIRFRLTLAFAGVMAVVLAATGAFVYLRLASDLDAGIDRSLATKVGDLATLASSTSATRRSTTSPLSAGDETFGQLLAADGTVLAAPPRLRAAPLLTPAQLRRAQRGPVRIARIRRSGLDEPARLLARPVVSDGRRIVVVAGATLDDRDEALASLARLLLIGGPAALLIASAAGLGLAAAALRPVDSMRRTAAQLSVAMPGERLPVPAGNDEITRLGRTLNELLARQEAAFARERTFVGDASHELRTPLAILRAELELALRGGRSVAELEAALRSAAEETDRLDQLAEDLLVIARSDQGALPVQLAEVDAGELLERMRDRFARRARDAGRLLLVEPAGGVRLLGDALRLEQALGNLLENGLRHGDGEIALAAEPDRGQIALHVRDAGPGFPQAFLATAFERFTRADPARGSGGAGLGLAIVQAIATAHGGRCGAVNAAGGGADVWLTVPGRASSSPSHPRSVDIEASLQPQEEAP